MAAFGGAVAERVAEPASASTGSPTAFAGAGVPIGLLDLPDEQRRATDTITDRDEQILVLGEPSAPVPEVLTTYAATLAVLLTGRRRAHLRHRPRRAQPGATGRAAALRRGGRAQRATGAADRALAGAGRRRTPDRGRPHRAAPTSGSTPPSPASSHRRLVLLVSGADRLLTTAEGADEPPPRAADSTDGRGDRGPHPGRARRAAEDRQPSPRDERRTASRAADRRHQRPRDRGRQPCVRRRAAHRAAGGRSAGRPRRATRPAGAGGSTGGPGDPLARGVAGTAGPATTATLRRRHVAVVVRSTPAAAPPTPPAHFVAPLPVAIDTESGEWVWVDGIDDGPVFAVAGQPKSGRSSTLAALARLAHEQGWTVLNVLSSPSFSAGRERRTGTRGRGRRRARRCDRRHGRSGAGRDRRPPAPRGLDRHRGGIEAFASACCSRCRARSISCRRGRA